MALRVNAADRALNHAALRAASGDARRQVGRLVAMLDAAGFGAGRAIELADEALVLLAEADRALWVADPVRVSTGPLRIAVERARSAAADRGAG